MRASADATVFHYSESDLGSFTTTNPCNGEIINVSGPSYLEFTVTMDGTGGSHFEAHYNFHDVTGQGGLGNTYHVPTAVSQEANVIVGQEFTFEYEQLFVSSGSADNFDLHYLVRVTVNPDGTVTTSQAIYSSTCRGRNGRRR